MLYERLLSEMFILLQLTNYSEVPPIVLLHGLFASKRSLGKLEIRLRNEFPGRGIYNFNVLLGGGSTVFSDIDYYTF